MKKRAPCGLSLGLAVCFTTAASEGCAADTAPAERASASASQAVSMSYYYEFTVDNVYIAKTRSPRRDTDVLAVAVTVGYEDGYTPDYGSASVALGDVGDGYHTDFRDANGQPSSATLRSIVVPPGATGHFGFTTMNSGMAGGASASLVKALNGISDAAHDFVSKLYPLPGVWDYLNQGTHALNQYFIGWCDGGVAADRLDLSADDLYDLTASTGSYDEWRAYPGTDSKAGCGSNSSYFVHWTITRTDIPSCSGPSCM